MKILYKNYIYKAVKVNDSLEKYADELIKRINENNFADFISTVVDNRGNELKIETFFTDAVDNPSYKSISENEKYVALPFNINLSTIRREIIHELLHSIDPKTYDKNLEHKEWGLGGYIKPNFGEQGRGNLKDHYNQLIEKDVHLSEMAHTAIQGRLDWGKEKLKREIRTGRILEVLNSKPELKTTENIKTFLKLCYYYVEKLL